MTGDDTADTAVRARAEVAGMPTRPALDLPPELRALLGRRSDALARRVESFLANAPRRCTYVRSERVAPHPLVRTGLARWISRPTAEPRLGVLDAKLGGLPYVEEPGLSWQGYAFLGQINFAQIEAPPPELPERGIFALDRRSEGIEGSLFRVRWYPHPSESSTRESVRCPCVGPWETRMRFSPGWSLPGGRAWDAPLPEGDEELWQAWNDWSPPGYLEDERDECHRILGHRAAGLDEAYEPPAGRSDAITDYEMLWRITFDGSAGFAWGTQWVYVLVHREDLAAGHLERAVVTAANY